MRTDSGICRYCGSVLQLQALRKVDDASGPDAYVCPECDEEADPGAEGIA